MKRRQGAGFKSKREHPRKQKRRERKEGKGVGGGRDACGLKKEASTCRELWNIANMGGLARTVRDLCDALLFLPPGGESQGEGALSLAISLQRATDAFVVQLKAHPPPVAPLYPPQWLQKRLMTSVSKFQEYTELHESLSLPAAVALQGVRSSGSAGLTGGGTGAGAGTDAGAGTGAGAIDGQEGADGGLDVDETYAMACQVHAALAAQRKGAPPETWWQRATDGILMWQSVRRISLES